VGELDHLGRDVGDREQARVGVTPGDDDVLVTGPLEQRRHDVVDVDPAPLHGVRELVEDVELVGLRAEATLDLRPALLCGGGVVLLGAGAA